MPTTASHRFAIIGEKCKVAAPPGIETRNAYLRIRRRYPTLSNVITNENAGGVVASSTVPAMGRGFPSALCQRARDVALTADCQPIPNTASARVVYDVRRRRNPTRPASAGPSRRRVEPASGTATASWSLLFVPDALHRGPSRPGLQRWSAPFPFP
jgi:hypothetical protein